jgi:ABC-type lipoprotein export system ATPase subunit
MVKVNQIVALSKKHFMNAKTTPCSIITALFGCLVAGMLVLVAHNATTANIYYSNNFKFEITAPLLILYTPNDAFHSKAMSYLPSTVTAKGFATADLLVENLFKLQEHELKYWEDYYSLYLETINNKTSYTLVQAGTKIKSISIQMAIDNALISNQKGSKVTMQAQTLQIDAKGPFKARQTEFKIEKLLFPVIMAWAGIAIFCMIINIIANEKQQKTMGLLRRLGLIESSYTISLIFLSIMISLLSAVISTVCLKVFARSTMTMIYETDYLPLIIIQFSFNFCMAGYAYMIGAVISRQIFVNSSIGIIMVLILALNLYFSISGYVDITGYGNIKGIYDQSWISTLLILFFPWVEYAKIWLDIASITGFRKYTFDSMGASPFSLVDLEKQNFSFDTLAILKKIPTSGFSVMCILIMSVVYFILGWYLQQVVPSSEGLFQPWNFVFTKAFWLPDTKKATPYNANDELCIAKNLSRENGGIYAIKLTKSYESKTAVKEFSKAMERGKIYALLGHNGAGKSTLINMLSCLTSPTFGDCFINGFSIKENIIDIQNLTGICPQDNLFYGGLTSFQHIDFYVKFRNFDISKFGSIELYAKDLLNQVDLDGNMHELPAGYSGGMKRRLSLALSTIGNKSILFLDEPTTGMY